MADGRDLGLWVAIDADDVLVDYCGGLAHAVKTEYGVDVSFDRWDLSSVLDPVLGEPWWEWMRDRDWLWANFPAVEGAIGSLRILRRKGYYLEIVTSKPEWAEYAMWRWLGKWRPPVQRVTIVDPKTPKWQVTEARLLVDDKPENVHDFRRAGRDAILFARPHNREAQETHEAWGMPWARDWGEVLSWIERLTSSP